ncbi:MAG: hypothetical protein ACRD1K_04995 [Acidimicrobiales bacterium]
MNVRAQVSLEYAGTDDEVAAVAAAFAEAGIDADVLVDLENKGAGGEFPWVVLISVPTTWFFAAFAGEAGKDAFKTLKTLIKRLYHARKTAQLRTGAATLIDEETSTWINLPPDLPDEALRQLPQIPLNELPSRVLRWDRVTGRWRGETPRTKAERPMAVRRGHGSNPSS